MFRGALKDLFIQYDQYVFPYLLSGLHVRLNREPSRIRDSRALRYPLVLCYIFMEKGPFSLMICLLKRMVFHSKLVNHQGYQISMAFCSIMGQAGRQRPVPGVQKLGAL